MEVKEIGQVKLFGDWNLKIKFTYNVLQVRQSQVSDIKLEPSKISQKNRPEEVKIDQNGNQDGG